MTSHLNGHNGGENDNTPPEGPDNIIRIPTLAERDRARRDAEKRRRHENREPLINMPPATKILLGLIIAAYLVTGIILDPLQADALIMQFGLVPAAIANGTAGASLYYSPLTHMFLHGGWMHVTLNCFMLAAFGSGIEKWIGTQKMLALFFLSGLCGALAHYGLNSDSPYPMIGASGALSGLFAGALLMMNRGQREMGGKVGLLPFALIWIGLSIGFGMMGGPDGSMIAWAAHVGGFLGGFAVLKLLKV